VTWVIGSRVDKRPDVFTAPGVDGREAWEPQALAGTQIGAPYVTD
jgi:hypothetical protein